MRHTYRRLRRFGVLTLPLVAALTLSGCEGILDVVAPGVLTSDELEGPESVPVVVAGLTNDFQTMLEEYVLYSGLFTDEFILAGTFPTRFDVDERNIRPSNGSVLGDIYEPINVSRFTADTAAFRFEQALGTENFGLTGTPSQSDLDAQERRLLEGKAQALLRAAYDRVYLAELFCESAISSADPTVAPGSPVDSDTRMADALTKFEQAEQAAIDASLADVEAAALVGQARAMLWLATMGAGGVTWAQVESKAASVDPGFGNLVGERDASSTATHNEVYGVTWGDQWTLRWTVGDGDEPSRHNERFMYYGEWESLGLLFTDADAAGITGNAFNQNIEVNAQFAYTSHGDDIPFVSGAEADMIEAEAILRQGGRENEANAIVNPYRAAWGLAAIDFANTGSFNKSEIGLDPAGTYTDLEIQIAVLAREKLRETWLQGTRQGDLRRIFASPGLDLYPQGTVGNQTCFPLPQQEVTGS